MGEAEADRRARPTHVRNHVLFHHAAACRVRVDRSPRRNPVAPQPSRLHFFAVFVQRGDLGRRRVTHHHVTAAPRECDDHVAQALLIAGVEPFRGVAREARGLAQRRVGRIEIQKITRLRAVDRAIESRAAERHAGLRRAPWRRGGDSRRRRCAASHIGRPAR